MKAFVLSDEITQFHWAMLKSVLLILTVLPMMNGAVTLWQGTEGSSQIMIGFFALSVMSAWLVVCFMSALKATVWQSQSLHSVIEQKIFSVYRYVPMLFLSSLVAYFASQFTSMF
ncbi:hypothetical protein [Acinetobacter sp. ANC 4178]|uniref:hypothetical protein n=1 Tax=Acinetobacter sp. ANC 4178 TaxID=2529839 RepID=UPI001040B27B|nr:hypothetical protein [Acinetobacter sp. ANC 4178]TCB67806.1 hypothetical protein E0H87_06375 [Acinetobacter sp. ANC 4178]